MKILISYPVTTFFQLTIERDQLPDDPQDLLDSISKDELGTAPCEYSPVEWDDMKTAWRGSTPEDTCITDQEGNDLFPLLTLND
nr:hypothetical protein 23 [Paracoccaceae bacterium]